MAYDLTAQPAPSSCRIIEFEKAAVYPGIVPGTWILVVEGIKPCYNMTVQLMPLVYVQCPDFWAIEVIGCLPDGICLTATAPYSVTIPLSGITGSSGVEVIGSNKQQKLKVSGGCSGGTFEEAS